MSHPGHHDVLRFLKREQSGDERRRMGDHLRRCPSCRKRVDEEAAFDRTLRRGLSYTDAPPHLIDSIRAGLQRESRRGSRPGRVWVSSGTAAAAAVLAFFLVLMPGAPLRLSEGLLASGPTAGVVRQLHGRLVCFGCARMGVALEQQRRCRGNQGEHVTGMQGDDGRLWRFMDGNAAEPLVADPTLRGRRVEVSARLYDNIDYMRVYAARTL